MIGYLRKGNDMECNFLMKDKRCDLKVATESLDCDGPICIFMRILAGQDRGDSSKEHWECNCNDEPRQPGDIWTCSVHGPQIKP